MGIFDAFQGLGNLSPDQTQGLLAAAAQMLQQSGPSRMPTSFGQIAGGGLGAYQQGMDASRKRKVDEDQAAQAAQLHALQIQGLTGELGDKETGRQQQLAAQKWLQDYNARGASPTAKAQSVLGQNMAPTVENANALNAAGSSMDASPRQSIYDRQLMQADAMRNSGNPLLIAQADALEKTALAARPKYSNDFRTAVGPDGKLRNYVLNDNGEFKDTGLGVAPKIREIGLGGSTKLIDDNMVVPGQSFAHTQSPDSRAVDRRAATELAAGGAEPSLNVPTLDFLADQALRGDTSVYQNLGRGAQGAANLVALRTRVAQKAQGQGLGGADLASIGADYQGQKAGMRATGNISARIENAAAEAAQLAPLAVEAGRNVARSGFLPFGKAQVLFNTNTNDPALNRFATANIGLATAYASAMARGNKPTVSDNEHARELLSTAKSQPAYEAIVSQMQQEIKAAQAAPQVVRGHLRDQIRGGSESEPTSSPNPFNEAKQQAQPARKSVLKGQVLDGYRFKGGDPSNQANWEKQ